MSDRQGPPPGAIRVITNPHLLAELDAEDELRALPYRPTCKMTPSKAPAYLNETGGANSPQTYGRDFQPDVGRARRARLG